MEDFTKSCSAVPCATRLLQPSQMFSDSQAGKEIRSVLN